MPPPAAPSTPPAQAEGDNQKRYMRTRRSRDEFLAYRLRTSPLIPMPQCLYAALPRWFCAYFLFEWSMYATDWTYIGEVNDPADKRRGEAAAGAAAGSYQEQPVGDEAPPPPPPQE